MSSVTTMNAPMSACSTGTWPVTPMTSSTNSDVSTDAATPGMARSTPVKMMSESAPTDERSRCPRLPVMPMRSRARFLKLGPGEKYRAMPL